MEMVCLDTGGGSCSACAQHLSCPGTAASHGLEQRPTLVLPQQTRQELGWPARNPVLLLLPGCQAVKIKIKDLDSRPLCDCPTFFFESWEGRAPEWLSRLSLQTLGFSWGHNLRVVGLSLELGSALRSESAWNSLSALPLCTRPLSFSLSKINTIF